MRDAEARANTAVERRCRSGKQAAEKLEISAFFHFGDGDGGGDLLHFIENVL